MEWGKKVFERPMCVAVEFEEKAERYREIFKLKQMLEDAAIPFKFSDREIGFQIEYPESDLRIEHGGCRVCSAIQGFVSYGGNEDLIEIQGLTQNGEDVEGYLSADEVFSRISAHYESCVLKQ